MRWLPFLVLVACSSPASQDAPDANNIEVSVPPDAASDVSFDAGIQSFIPPNKTAPDAGNPWCQKLFCYDSVELLPECVTECILLPPSEQHLIAGPQCQDCANPLDVQNCGYYCVAGLPDAG
jgi:hypothetical protein